MASIDYPVVNGTGGTTYPYSYDTMARLTGVTSWATGAQYNAADQLTSLTYGYNTETRQYNALNQLTLISSSAFTQQHVYSATQNNARIIQQEGGPQTGHGRCGRIASATCTTTFISFTS